MGKILDIQNLNIVNSEVVVRQFSNKTLIDKKIANANITEYNSKAIYEIDSEWVDYHTLRDADDVGDIRRQSMTFTTVYEQYPENLIPYISSIVIFQQIGNNVETIVSDYNPDNIRFYNPSDGFSGYRDGSSSIYNGVNIFQIEDIENNSDFKRVTMITTSSVQISVSVPAGEELPALPQFQAKLKITIKNPKEFWRIS